MKELRQIASVMLSMCLSCFVGFAQTEGSDDTVVDDEVVAEDVEVVVNNGYPVTPKPAFTFVYKEASALDAEGNALTKNWLRNNVSITVGGTEIDFVVGPLTNGADTNIDTLSFITMDNYYLPSRAKVEVTMPDLSFGEGYNDIESQTYTFYVENYITIGNATDKPDFNEITSVVIESGITYEVAEGDKMLCKTLVLEGGATLKNKGVVEVKDTAFYHCIEESYFDQAGLINFGEYSAASSVFVKFSSNIVKREDKRNQIITGNMIKSSMKLKDLTIYPFTFYSSNQSIQEGGYYSLSSWVDGQKDKYLSTEYGYMSFYNQINSYFEDGYFRFKGDVRDAETVSMSNLVVKNVGLRMPNPYPAMLDLNEMVSDPLNTSGMGAKQLLKFAQMPYANKAFYYNTHIGITTYDGEMWKGYLMPVGTGAINHVHREYTYNIKKEHLTDMQTAKAKYEGQEIKYPYVRFYCDYVDKDKAHGKGYRAVFAVYFVDEDTYQEVLDTRNVKWQIADIYESRDLTMDKSLEGYIMYPYFGIFRQQGKDASKSFITIGAEKMPDVGSSTKVNIGVARELAANTAENDEDYKVKIGILDHNLGSTKIRFKCEELGLSFDNPHVTWSGKGETKEIVDGVETTILYHSHNSDRKLFEFDFYAEENPSEIPDIDEEDITAVDEVDVACTLSVENSKVVVNGVNEGAIVTLTSLSGMTLDKKDVKNGVVSFEISDKGIYFVAVEQGNATKVFKLLIK